MQNISPAMHNEPFGRTGRRSFFRTMSRVLEAALFMPIIENALVSEHRRVLDKPVNIDPAYSGAVGILLARYMSGSNTIDFLVSYLQRRLRLGYVRALSIVAEMKRQGIISCVGSRWRIHDAIASVQLLPIGGGVGGIL